MLSACRSEELAVRILSADRKSSRLLPTEHRLNVFVNEQPAMRIACTPEHLDELVSGRLLTEGLIRSAEEIRKIYICEAGLTCRVWLREGVTLRHSDAAAADVSTCCTDNRVFLERSKEEMADRSAAGISGDPALYAAAGGVPDGCPPMRWDPGWLPAVSARLQQGEPLFRMTHATHACYLVRQDEVLCCREDIGRHNALDKAVGYGLLAGVDLAECWLFTTGRMAADMVRKAVRAGVSMMASKSWPTDQGVAAARQAGLVLITVPREGEPAVWADGTEGQKIGIEDEEEY